ncbi:multidrug effflux MFS transporter [Labrys monachus]|uniref:Bcr/CflA family efflux transporter n=1 Tax=Labrys monachus TaxID=217067 RepID=A0ABU0FPE0_9HYPH|nr:multidrug effflux MFS transporter [Labrys monachus]MDQ0395969.1 DHA1 family bicyclomycin/chloramphenicol resistance-like MFS transporter [Labrys monachus]
MSRLPAAPASKPAPEPSFLEFVLVIALMMGLVSLSIDNLLPAFDSIRSTFGVADPNRMQLVLTAYMAGFGIMQLVWGPVSDTIGRRKVLMIGLAIYTAGTVLAIFAPNYETLLLARAVQGMGGAAARVLSIAIIRDRYSGRDMARVMSLTLMIFIVVPVVAPAMGSAFLILGSWHYIFVSMLGLVIAVAIWFGLRMPETLHPEYRRKLSIAMVAFGIGRVVNNRASLTNMLAMGLAMGCLMTYVGSAQQIFETDIYKLGPWFPLAFGMIAICMGIASFTNSRLVKRLGMHKLSRAGMAGFTVMAAILLAEAYLFDGRPPLLVFGITMGIAHFLLSLTLPNFNALAMEPVGDVAGTASSFIGCVTTIMGAVIGGLIGEAYNGTIFPLACGYLGLSALCLVVMYGFGRSPALVASRAPAMVPGE